MLDVETVIVPKPEPSDKVNNAGQNAEMGRHCCRRATGATSKIGVYAGGTPLRCCYVILAMGAGKRAKLPLII